MWGSSARRWGCTVDLYGAGTISVGTALLLYQYMSLVEEPIDQLTQQLQDLQKAGASLMRVGEVLSLRSELPSGARVLPSGPLELRFDDVSFAYEPGLADETANDTARVLSSLDFTVQAGRTVGLLGRTGSGKSSLTRLISRLCDPTFGVVRLGGVSTVDADLHSLCSRVAVVTQDVQLFKASVRDNLTFFGHDMTDVQVRAALAEVGLLEWADSLPEGLDTPLPAGSLSAGEAQLLAFARVMLRDPGLIILDEPSSRLDPASEARLSAAMTRLLSGRTAIVIAHRLGTVARADDILVLGDGKVLEFGPREVLAAAPGSRYAQLLKAGQHGEVDAVLA